MAGQVPSEKTAEMSEQAYEIHFSNANLAIEEVRSAFNLPDLPKGSMDYGAQLW
jgi:hypothetical protein